MMVELLILQMGEGQCFARHVCRMLLGLRILDESADVELRFLCEFFFYLKEVCDFWFFN